MGRQALRCSSAVEVQHISNSHLDTQVYISSDHRSHSRLRPMGDVHVQASASSMGPQRRRHLRKSAILHDLRLHPELDLGSHRYHHGNHAIFHSAEVEDRYADEVLCCFDYGPWVSVSPSNSRHELSGD